MKEVFSYLRLWIKFAHMTFAGKALLLILAVGVTAPMSSAQDVGTIDGRLVNGTGGGIPAGVPLNVIGLTGGMSVLKSGATEPGGGFRITGLPTNAPLLLRATYGGVSYYGQVSFDASGKANVEIQVFEPTASMEGIRLESAQIAFQLTTSGLISMESYTFENGTRPPRSFMREDGNFRIFKTPGISELPRLDVTGPGSGMPVTQSFLESADGQSYYSLYPLRPGATTFEVGQSFPYQNDSFVYRKRFYQDIASLKIGVIPKDMQIAGAGLSRIQTDAAQNFAVYSTGPIKAGTEVVWTFSGGTPVAASQPAQADPSAGATIQSVPTAVGQNAVVIGALLLIGFGVIFWFAHSRVIPASDGGDARNRALKERREQLLNYVASMDVRYEKSQGPERRAYLRARAESKRHLRRIAMLLTKK